MGAAVLHRHEFVEIVGVESPGIHNLVAMGVNDLDDLSLPHAICLPPAGRNRQQFLARHVSFLLEMIQAWIGWAFRQRGWAQISARKPITSVAPR
jgi:hypothetical protein